MDPKQRRLAITERVAREGRQSVEALARAYNVSSETIRRDLTVLATEGVIRKVHGAALGPRLHAEGTFPERMSEDAGAKHTIAQHLTQLIDPGETIFMDTGSTTLLAARALVDVPGLTIITNSAAIADAMSRAQRATVYLLGGAYRSGNTQTVGPIAIEQVSRFRADRAVLTVAALDAQDAMDSDVEEAQLARAMIRQSREITIIASASKLQRRAAFPVCRLNEIDVLVCDRDPPEPLTAALSAAEVSVHVAGKDDAGKQAA